MKIGRLVPLVVLLLVIIPTIIPTAANAESLIFYFRNNHSQDDRVLNITNNANYRPICRGRNGPRFQGLDFARLFAGAVACPGTTGDNRFDPEVTHIFLINDAAPLSEYLLNSLRRKNLLQRIGGREVVAPGVRTFRGREGRRINVLVVGEMTYREGGRNPDTWFTALANTPYMVACSDAQVPLPPMWRNNPDDNTAWQLRGYLDPDKIVATPEFPRVEVWAFSDSNGVCVALPRKNRSNVTQSLGIICQSERTGKACFWDSLRRRPAGRINPMIGAATDRMVPNMMRDGFDLNENCTKCHMGKNVFLIPTGGHPLSLEASGPRAAVAGVPESPGTPEVFARRAIPAMPALDRDPGPSSGSLIRYEPIPNGRLSDNPQSRWENPAPLMAKDSGPCTRCHEIPTPTEEYCRAVLKGVFLKNLMPPPGNGNWFDPAFAGDATFIAEKCRDDHGVAIGVLRRLSP